MKAEDVFNCTEYRGDVRYDIAFNEISPEFKAETFYHVRRTFFVGISRLTVDVMLDEYTNQ